MKKFFAVLLGALMTVVCSSCSFVVSVSRFLGFQEFNNVILVIGDGMGMNHILNAIDYFDLETPAFLQDQYGYIGTNSLSGTTDSAAGGTALATGKKVINGNVGMLFDENLEQITTIAKSVGMKTGVITTDVLNGATPASFSAHALNRNDTNDIIKTQAISKIDLFMAKSNSNYYSHEELFNSNGYTFFDTTLNVFESNLNATIEKLNEVKNSKKLLATFQNVSSEYIDTYNAKYAYQLKDMAKYAVEFLENRQGFFLMIEGAYIDKYSHNNNYHNTMCEVRSLIDTIDYLYEYASDGETAIFITADHETGGLQRAEGETLGTYTSIGHTPTPVPLFVKNYALQLADYEDGAHPENTIVFDACKSIILG